MTFLWKGVPLTPALTEVDTDKSLNAEQRRILDENFVSDACKLTDPVAKLAYAYATPAPYAMSNEERHRPMLDMDKLDAAGISAVEKLRLVDETKIIGVALAELALENGLRTISEVEYRHALARVKHFLREES